MRKKKLDEPKSHEANFEHGLKRLLQEADEAGRERETRADPYKQDRSRPAGAVERS